MDGELGEARREGVEKSLSSKEVEVPFVDERGGEGGAPPPDSASDLSESRKVVAGMLREKGLGVVEYGGERCISAAERKYKVVGKDGVGRNVSIPGVIFPERFLGQRKMTPDQLKRAAEWFVYKIGADGEVVKDSKGRPEYNDLFAFIKEITEERHFFLVDTLAGLARSETVRKLMKRMDVCFPYYESDAMVEIAKVAFASRLKSKYHTGGSQLFYEAIGPVYEFFHQMNTQAVQSFGEGEFRQVGGLPLSVIRAEKFAKDTEYYPNDAKGRDDIAKEIAEAVKEEGRVLAVGDGPALTTLKAAMEAVGQGKRNVEFVVLEYNAEQINNGRRAYENLSQEDKDRLRQAGVKISWVRGDASKMPIADETFDLVFSTYAVGAMGGEKFGPGIVSGYAQEAGRVLKPGGKHITLDFYFEGEDMREGYEQTSDPQQKKAREAYKLLKGLIDGPLKNCYEGIWDHITSLNDTLINASRDCGLGWRREHRQTWFGHFPILRVGGWVLAFSVPGYNEIKNVFEKPQSGPE